MSLGGGRTPARHLILYSSRVIMALAEPGGGSSGAHYSVMTPGRRPSLWRRSSLWRCLPPWRARAPRRRRDSRVGPQPARRASVRVGLFVRAFCRRCVLPCSLRAPAYLLSVLSSR